MIDLLFDSYSRQARLYPALITLLPPLITVLAWYPGLLSSHAAATVVTLATSCGLLYALATFSRSRGKNVERRLLVNWGGWPTTQWLRHSDQHLPAQTKDRYRGALLRHVPDLQLPSPTQDNEDPQNADEAYRSAVEWLKERCRGKDFPLVEKENAEYGFRRNLRGLRPFGTIVVLLALAASAFGIWKRAALSSSGLQTALWPELIDKLLEVVPVVVSGAVVLDLAALVFWLVIVSDGWVRQAGDQYARALLACCDRL
jgi:hypothetical protein